MKIVFMGTPDFAVSALQAIIEAGHEVAAVVTQPDKPRGRGREMQATPVKVCALAHDIPVFQPVKIREPEAVGTLRAYGADIFVVAAFGQILTEEILTMPRYGCVNIHASLLPKYRGAAPIQQAVIDGEKVSGVTIMQMDRGIDTGDILMKAEVPIADRETGDSLHDKLAAAGARLITEALPLIERGEVTPVKQNDEEASYVRTLRKNMGRIDWQQDAVTLDRLIRGLLSWPGAFTVRGGRILKIWEAEPVTAEEMRPKAKILPEEAEPGTVALVERDAFYVRTGNGFMKILAVQPEGKKRMAVSDFLRGYPVEAGELLGA